MSNLCGDGFTSLFVFGGVFGWAILLGVLKQLGSSDKKQAAVFIIVTLSTGITLSYFWVDACTIAGHINKTGTDNPLLTTLLVAPSFGLLIMLVLSIFTALFSEEEEEEENKPPSNKNTVIPPNNEKDYQSPTFTYSHKKPKKKYKFQVPDDD